MKKLILAAVAVMGFGSIGFAAPPVEGNDGNPDQDLAAYNKDIGADNSAAIEKCDNGLKEIIEKAKKLDTDLTEQAVAAAAGTMGKDAPVSVLCNSAQENAYETMIKQKAVASKLEVDFKKLCAHECSASNYSEDPNRSEPQNEKGQQKMQQWQRACNREQNKYEAKYAATTASLSTQASSYSTCLSHWKTGAKIAAGVGAVALGVAAYNRHQDANHREKLTNEVNNAIIHNADGTTTDCKLTTTYSSAACQPALLAYCSKPQNSAMPGCGAFTQSYCSGANASMSFCLAGSARSYCAAPGPMTAQSPACVWMSNLPASCSSGAGAGSINCLSAQSPTQLASLCPNFPTDPLCQAYNSGQVVTQPSTGAGMPVAGAPGTSTTLPVANGTATSASTGTTSAAGGFGTVTSRSASTNLFVGNSSTLSSLCAQGHLIGCK